MTSTKLKETFSAIHKEWRTFPTSSKVTTIVLGAFLISIPVNIVGNAIVGSRQTVEETTATTVTLPKTETTQAEVLIDCALPEKNGGGHIRVSRENCDSFQNFDPEELADNYKAALDNITADNWSELSKRERYDYLQDRRADN